MMFPEFGPRRDLDPLEDIRRGCLEITAGLVAVGIAIGAGLAYLLGKLLG